MFILINGHVSISKRLGKKKGALQETELAVIKPGQCFGEMGLIDKRARSAKATAKDNAVLFSISDTMLVKYPITEDSFQLH